MQGVRGMIRMGRGMCDEEGKYEGAGMGMSMYEIWQGYG